MNKNIFLLAMLLIGSLGEARAGWFSNFFATSSTHRPSEQQVAVGICLGIPLIATARLGLNCFGRWLQEKQREEQEKKQKEGARKAWYKMKALANAHQACFLEAMQTSPQFSFLTEKQQQSSTKKLRDFAAVTSAKELHDIILKARPERDRSWAKNMFLSNNLYYKPNYRQNLKKNNDDTMMFSS